MKSGSIVEFIDRQKIICAVVLEVKKQRLRVLTEGNREVNLSANRVLHATPNGLDASMGRNRLLDSIQRKAEIRRRLTEQVDVRELWEVVNSEQEWIDIDTMTAFCFPDEPTDDHASAVIRAFFEDRSYFKFNQDQFYPYSQEQVAKLAARKAEALRRERIVREGGDWLRRILSGRQVEAIGEQREYTEILKSIFLFDKDSPHYAQGKGMISRAGIDAPEALFETLVRIGVFDPDENTDLLRFDIPTDFRGPVEETTARLIAAPPAVSTRSVRKDLTHLEAITIDGQSTLDFDDALSVEVEDGHYRVGIHIADVGHFIARGDTLDSEALRRGSSIYMPDRKISMLPSSLAEGLCSLKAGKNRAAISILAWMNSTGDILSYEITPSVIRVTSQLSYYDANLALEGHPQLQILYDLARRFRERRLDAGAVQINLPDISVWLEPEGGIRISKINRESPGRLLVSELMILGNWLMGRFLKEHGAPAVFRGQVEPRERLYKGDEGTLFQNWMQRKLIHRFVLGSTPEDHSGLGLDVYVTATSPIRKYFDLVTQRQLRAISGIERPYTVDEIDGVIQVLGAAMTRVSRTQYRRNRYWLLKYLEGRVGQKEEAIVLYRKKNAYLILLTDYMLECDLPVSEGISLAPENLIRVTVQHVNARRDRLSVFIA